mgnify:FL=1
MQRLIPFLALTLVLNVHCGSDSSDAEVSGLCAENGVTTTIGDNHPRGDHELDIPVDDVVAGVEKTYDIQGDNVGHGHTVTISPDDFTAIDSGAVVTLTSSDNGAVGDTHTHPVTLSCNLEA